MDKSNELNKKSNGVYKRIIIIFKIIELNKS